MTRPKGKLRQQVSFDLDVDTIKKIDELVVKGGFVYRVAVIREAVDKLHAQTFGEKPNESHD